MRVGQSLEVVFVYPYETLAARSGFFQEPVGIADECAEG
jgi:hypothetical protein